MSHRKLQSTPVPTNPLTERQICSANSCDITKIYQNFRNAYPGETGPRNYLRYPGYVDLDLGLGKSWKMPYGENHVLQLRWDVFNVTNTQRLTSFADGGMLWRFWPERVDSSKRLL